MNLPHQSTNRSHSISGKIISKIKMKEVGITKSKTGTVRDNEVIKISKQLKQEVKISDYNLKVA